MSVTLVDGLHAGLGIGIIGLSASEVPSGLGCDGVCEYCVLLGRSSSSNCDAAGEDDKLQTAPYLVQLEQGLCSLLSERGLFSRSS